MEESKQESSEEDEDEDEQENLDELDAAMQENKLPESKVGEPSSTEKKELDPAIGDILNPNILATDSMIDMDDKRLDEEIKKQRETLDENLADQKVDEEELVDQNGQFIIFKNDNSPHLNPQS